LVLSWQAKYEEAEAMYRRALEARVKVLGPEHPSTLASVSNLVPVLRDQGKYEESRDEPMSAGGEGEGAGERASRHADDRLLPYVLTKAAEAL
jgi:hypothetical protein